MEFKKVIDMIGDKPPKHIYKIAHKIICYGHEKGNNSFIRYEVGDTEVSDYYLEKYAEKSGTPQELLEFDQWVKSLGCVDGEEVLIYHWW